VPVFVLLIIGAWSTHPTQSSAIPSSLLVQAPPACSRVGVIAVDPPSIADQNLLVGSSVTFNINVTNSCPITAFAVAIQYDLAVLKWQSIDQPVGTGDGSYPGTVLGLQAQPQHICVDGRLLAGLNCVALYDTAGVVSAALYVLSFTPTSDPTNGLLLKVTFKVIATGFSQLHVLLGVLSNAATGAQVSSTTLDGYFTNKICGIALCTPPVVNLVPNSNPFYQYQVATFNSTGSRSTNQNGFVQSRTWAWGDAKLGEPSSDTINVTSLSHIYTSTGIFYPTLTVIDNFGIKASKTIIITVVGNWVELSVGNVAIDHQTLVFPGTVIHIRSFIVNNSTVPENATLVVKLEGTILGQGSIQLKASRDTGNVSTTWDTTGYSPRVYRIDSVALPVPGQNSTSHSVKSSYVQLIEPRPSGTLSLSLLQSSGLGVILVAALVFLASRLKKRPSWETEPL
jgi:hypothetical protein